MSLFLNSEAPPARPPPPPHTHRSYGHVKCSETVVINLHVIVNTFVNIRMNSHTLHFYHSDLF